MTPSQLRTALRATRIEYVANAIKEKPMTTPEILAQYRATGIEPLASRDMINRALDEMPCHIGEWTIVTMQTRLGPQRRAIARYRYGRGRDAEKPVVWPGEHDGDDLPIRRAGAAVVIRRDPMVEAFLARLVDRPPTCTASQNAKQTL